MENKEYVDFIVTARKYKTQLTKKFINRTFWQKPLAGDVFAYLPGTVISLEVKVGDQVEAGDLILMLEAMKMLNRVVSPISGVVTEICVAKGDKVGKNHLMLKIESK